MAESGLSRIPAKDVYISVYPGFKSLSFRCINGMRLLMLISVILFAVAFVCFAVPTAVLGLSGLGWTAAGLFFMALDFLLGDRIVTPVGRRV